MKHSFSCTFVHRNSLQKMLSSVIFIVLIYFIAHLLARLAMPLTRINNEDNLWGAIGQAIYKGFLIFFTLRFLAYTVSLFNYKLCRHHKKLSVDDFHDEEWTNEYATNEFTHYLIYKDTNERIFVSARLIGFLTNEMKLYPKENLIWVYDTISDSFLNRLHLANLHTICFHFSDGSTVKLTAPEKQAQIIFAKICFYFPNILHEYSDKLISLFYEDTQTFIEIINDDDP